MVRHGSRLECWNTTARSIPGPWILRPSIDTEPSSYGRSPAIMFSSEVVPQPLGPTMAMNSPSATDNDTSISAGASVPSRSSQYRLDTWLTSSLTMSPCLPEGRFGFAVLLRLDSRSEGLLEEPVLDQPFHVTIVYHLVEIVGLHLRRKLRIGLLVHHRFDRRRQHKRDPLKGLRLGVQIVHPRHFVRLRRLIVLQECLHRERLIFIEALDRLGLRLNQFFGQFGIGRGHALLHQVRRGGEDFGVIGEVRQRLEPLLLYFEIRRSGQ